MLLLLQEVGEDPKTGTSTSLVIDLSCQPGKLSEERVGAVQPGEEKALGRPYSSLPVPEWHI